MSGNARRNKTETEIGRMGHEEKLQWPYYLVYRFADSGSRWPMYFQTEGDRAAFVKTMRDGSSVGIVVEEEGTWRK